MRASHKVAIVGAARLSGNVVSESSSRARSYVAEALLAAAVLGRR